MSSCKLLVGAMTVVLATIATSIAANAHSQLKSSVPASGAVLQEAPGEAVVVFNEDAKITSIRLFDDAGASLDLPGEPSRAPGSASIELPSLSKGAYVIEWRALSVDGHPIRGRIPFIVEGVR